MVTLDVHPVDLLDVKYECFTLVVSASYAQLLRDLV